jgi:hypothetical protein
MKLFQFFQRNKCDYNVYQYQHYQFLIIKGKTLLHLMYGDDNPCPYTGFISTPSSLTNYQRNRGIDTSKRVRIS